MEIDELDEDKQVIIPLIRILPHHVTDKLVGSDIVYKL